MTPIKSGRLFAAVAFGAFVGGFSYFAFPGIGHSFTASFCTPQFGINQCLAGLFNQVQLTNNFCTPNFSVNQCLNQIFGSGNLKIKLNANTTFYVNATGAPQICGADTSVASFNCGIGHDNITGVASINPATPFATLPMALGVIQNTFDYNGFHAIINMAHGTSVGYGGASLCAGVPYTSTISGGSNGASLGFGTTFISGDKNAPTAVGMVAPNGAWALMVGHFCVAHLQYVSISDQGTALCGTQTTEWGGIDLQGVTFGSFNTAAFLMCADGYSHYELCSNPSPCIATNSTTGAGFIRLQSMSRFNFGESDEIGTVPFQIGVNSNMVCSVACIQAIGPTSLYQMSAATFTGGGVAGTTGPRAILRGGGYMNAGATNCNSIIPGSTPCQFLGFYSDFGDAQTNASWQCAPYTPTDQSTAGLTFSAVSAEFCIYGNMVTVFGTVTYPATADANTAAISLPVAVPNQPYANASEVAQNTNNGNAIWRAVAGTSKMTLLQSTALATFANSTVSGRQVFWNLTYPIQ